MLGKKGVRLHPIVQAICFKKPVKSLNSCQTIVCQKSLFFHPIVQAICFKKPVESLNSCQTIVRQKKLIFSYYCTGNMLQKACGKFESKKLFGKKSLFFYIVQALSRQFLKKLIEIFVGHFTGNKFAKMYTNCRHFFPVFFLQKCLLLKCKKKSQKAWKFPYNRQTFY
jgi:hypothetical protein